MDLLQDREEPRTVWHLFNLLMSCIINSQHGSVPNSAWHGGARLESIYPSFGHQDADSKKLCSDIVFNWALLPNSKQLRLSLHGSETCLTCWVKKKTKKKKKTMNLRHLLIGITHFPYWNLSSLPLL